MMPITIISATIFTEVFFFIRNDINGIIKENKGIGDYSV